VAVMTDGSSEIGQAAVANTVGGPPLVSVVVPVQNEEPNIAPLYRAVHEHLDDLNLKLEFIFVEDGSRDGTVAEIRALMRQHPEVRLIRFTRIFGHQAALMGGIDAARGDAVITMDCDLQHPPEHLPRMVEAWRQGHFVVQMVRRETTEAAWKKLGSKLFYKLINKLSQVPLSPGAADFQLLDRRVVDDLLGLRDVRPFVRGMIAWLGYPTFAIDYVAPARAAGERSYNFVRSISLAVLGITSMSRMPLRWAFYCGLVVAFFCLAYIVSVVIAFYSGYIVPGWSSLIASVLFLGALQLVTLGIIGEYIGKLFERSRNLPPYVALPEVREEVASEHPSTAAPDEEHGGGPAERASAG
jgi:dolichol-phosphate mannosyltransferase